MLIEFTVANHLSFRDPVTLSLLASGKVSEHRAENVIPHDRMPLLKTAVVYGANASGKSNLLISLGWMRGFVINSSKESQAGEPIDVKPFKLDIDCLENSSCFEVMFFADGIRYRYAFEVTGKQVLRECLHKAEKSSEKLLFLRIGEDIEISSDFAEGQGLEEKTRPNALFLSVVANLNGKTSGRIIEWFNNLRFLHGLKDRLYANESVEMLRDENQREQFMDMIRRADLGIDDLVVEERDIENSATFKLLGPKWLEQNSIHENVRLKYPRLLRPWDITLGTIHKRYKNGEPFDTVTMDLEEEESEGTRKFFRLIGPVLKCLNDGSVLVADELEAKLHPLLTRMIVRLFHASATNPKNAQLIFATHDTNLLQHVRFRRDQIWFTEKTRQQATDLYSLAEIKLPKGTVRKDARYEKDYFRGRYGAIPYLGAFEELFNRNEETDGTTG